MRRALCIAAFAAAVFAQPPKRLLFVTHSAGFRHGSIEEARRTFDRLRSPALDTRWTEDVSLLTANGLSGYDAVFFFTSGELPMSEEQRAALLAFVRNGGGFGGAHSATDTFYAWPAYGELIGGYFDGHPWTQVAGVEVEDPDHPATREVPTAFRILEEFYQFRAWDRRKVRVLMTLDPESVSLAADGVNRTDLDFALAWCHEYGKGRVFYTALGHFDETWRDPRFESMLRGAVRWLVGDEAADASPRFASLTLDPLPAMAPGALVELAGSGLTAGHTADAASFAAPPFRLAAVTLRFGDRAAPLFRAAPGRVMLQVPFEAPTGESVEVVLRSAGSEARRSVRLSASAPRVLGVAGQPPVVSIFAAGLGAVQPFVATGAPSPSLALATTIATPSVRIAGVDALVQWSGLAPGLTGVYQVNVAADRVPAPEDVVITMR